MNSHKCDSDLVAVKGMISIACVLVAGIVMVLILRPGTETTLIVALATPLGGVITGISSSISNGKRGGDAQDVNVVNQQSDPVPTVTTQPIDQNTPPISVPNDP